MRKTDGQYSYTFRRDKILQKLQGTNNRPMRALETPGTFSVAVEEDPHALLRIC
jgi:hypothetical protein